MKEKLQSIKEEALAQIQAAIIVAGDLWLLKVNIVEPGLFSWRQALRLRHFPC